MQIKVKKNYFYDYLKICAYKLDFIISQHEDISQDNFFLGTNNGNNKRDTKINA